MNNPSPFVPQGTTPSKGKSSLYFKVLMILALHVAVFGGILLQGCKDTTKTDTTASTPPPDTSSATNAPTNDVGPAPVTSNSTLSNTVNGQLPPMTTTSAPPPNVPTMPISAPNNPPPAPIATSDTPKDYVIVHGDTLGAVAKRNGVSLKALLEANPGVNPKKLKVGQKIEIPASAGATPSATTSTMDGAASGDSVSYTVKSGDTLGRIARSHHTNVKAIMALNDMKSTGIRSGQKIKLPTPAGAAESTSPAPTATTSPLQPQSLNAANTATSTPPTTTNQ
jgi:LysM repeat protein